MKNILETILAFLKKAFSKDYIGLTFGVIILLLVVFNLQTCQNLSQEKKQRELDVQLNKQNLQANSDSLKTYFDIKLKQAVGEKTSYLVRSLEDLAVYNKKLYDEINSVKGSVAGIQSSVSTIIPSVVSAISKPIIDPNDSTKRLIPWNFDYNDPGLTQKLIGRTQFRIVGDRIMSPIISTLDTNKFVIKLNYNFVDRDGKYIVRASSPSPLVRFTELDGALILNKLPNPIPVKTSPWSFGPYAGFGLNTDIIGSNARFGWSIGVGGSYNLFNGVKGGKLK